MSIFDGPVAGRELCHLPGFLKENFCSVWPLAGQFGKDGASRALSFSAQRVLSVLSLRAAYGKSVPEHLRRNGKPYF
jgi:hypothetical protein